MIDLAGSDKGAGFFVKDCKNEIEVYFLLIF